MIKNTPTQRLKAQIEQIKSNAVEFDKAKLFDKNRFMNSKHRLFDPHLFSSKSMVLNDYVDEILYGFENLPPITHRRTYQFAIEKISEQLEAVIKVLNSTSVWKNDKPKYKKRVYKQAAKQIMQSSHELYNELNRNNEFERRLLLMVEQRKMQLQNSDSQAAVVINQEILALHARLGRCRKAISATEEKIQRVEKTK